MKRTLNILFFILFGGGLCQAQKPEQLLSAWSEKFPIEKAYLHFDRYNYIAGETAWFKAYLYSDYQPDSISTSLYVELLNDKNVVMVRAIVPVLLGTANGYFELADSLSSGSYIIRAYSTTMLNQDAGFIDKQHIFIYGKKNKDVEPVAQKEMRQVEFFPEGGNLVSNFLNTIAFKVTNENGLPADVKGKLLNEKNEVLTNIISYHNGMGTFELTPATNGKYYVLLDGDATARKYYLPEQTGKGIALTVIPHPQGNFFEVKQRKDNPDFQVAYIIGQMQHHIVFKQDFKTGKEEIQGVINTKNLHSGILQITFFNKNDQPLAERLCFVNNKEYILQAEFVTDTVNFSAKGKNHFSIQLKNTVQGSFSVSITDPDYNFLQVREENIFSNLLLTSDLKGYIHNPAFYFSADNDSVNTARDLVMMTNGWRRFKWSELSQKTSITNSYIDGSYITLSGKITLRDSKKPFAEKPLLLMLITADSAKNIQMTTTNKQGDFRLDSMLFFGKSRILFSDIRGKKSQFIDASLSADSLTRPFIFPAVKKYPFFINDFLLMNSQPKMAFDYDAIQKASGLMLEGVTVKTKKRSPIEELEEEYVRGAFSTDANRTIDLVSNKDAEPYRNIFDYLQMRVPGLQVLINDNEYAIYYRQTASVSAMGNIPMTIYLDEIETDASFVSIIPANQIALVKVFGNFIGTVGNGPGGVLAIYTRKGADMNDVMKYGSSMVKYNGYSITKEFYAPDYAADKLAKTKTDNRITLDWRPDILVNNVNPKIPVTFYNNDRTKSFKIVVEGMTLDGKMLMLEKTILPKAK